MACRLFAAKILSEPIMDFLNWTHEDTFSEIRMKTQLFLFRNINQRM